MVATRPSWCVVNQVNIMSTTTALDPRFEISYLPKWSGNIPCYMVAVPSYLGDKVCAYLKHHGCKFQQRWSEKRYGRCEFFIERIQPNIVQALADRTYANGGKVNLQETYVNPIALYWSALNDGRIETLEKLWKDIEWSPEESLDAEDCTYEAALNQTAMHLADINFPLGLLIASLV